MLISVNVPGQARFNCIVLVGYSSERSLRMDSYFGPCKGCDFGGETDKGQLRFAAPPHWVPLISIGSEAFSCV